MYIKCYVWCRCTLVQGKRKELVTCGIYAEVPIYIVKQPIFLKAQDFLNTSLVYNPYPRKWRETNQCKQSFMEFQICKQETNIQIAMRWLKSLTGSQTMYKQLIFLKAPFRIWDLYEYHAS